jgi:hypothetical protein
MAESIILTGRRLAIEIEKVVEFVVAGDVSLSRGYARLAHLLMLFKLNEGWRECGYNSFNSYLLTLKEKYNRSSQQLYAYVACAEKLLPYCGEAGLEKMGVSKGMELVKASKRAKKDIPKELIDAALQDSNGVSEIRALAFKVFELEGQDLPRGWYQDFGGAYLDEEEQKTFKEAVQVTKRYLGLEKETPEWLQRKRIILAWAQEFLGAYSADIYGKPTSP